MRHQINKKSVLIYSSDDTSKTKGSALGPLVLLDNMHSKDLEFTVIKANEDSSKYFYKNAATWFTENPLSKIAFGGEHLLTLPIVSILKRQKSKLKLVVFDAHHDAYPYHQVTHYSHFFYAFEELDIDIQFIGVRYEINKSGIPINNISPEELKEKGKEFVLSKIKTFLSDDPFYLSLDLDVLDPKEFGSVSFPVDNGLSKEDLLYIFDGLLASNPDFVDICEFNPLIANNHDKDFYLEVSQRVIQWYQKL